MSKSILVTSISPSLMKSFKVCCAENDISMSRCIKNLMSFYVRKKTGVDHGYDTVSNKIKEAVNNVSLMPANKVLNREKRDLLIIEKYGEGKNISQISLSTKVPRTTVTRVIHKYIKENQVSEEF